MDSGSSASPASQPFPNSPHFKPGDLILRLDAVTDTAFRGQQVGMTEQWHPVTAERLDAGTIRMQSGTTVRTMAHH